MPTYSAEHPLTIHMIGNAHIDPVWLWPMSEGQDEVLGSYRTAIMLLREFDSYVFSSGGAVTYKWVEERDPALFAEIQQAVADGRWALVNGWWLQPDCNIPGGESFARHALYGQRYLQRAFGKRAVVGYNVDSFGHAATLPQLLKLAGLDYYVFFRPGPHEKELPGGPFWWVAPGGQRVLACRPPLHYPSGPEAIMLERVREAAKLAPQGQDRIMCFYGVGNHGGGPTRQQVLQIMEINAQDPSLKPVFSSPDTYFTAMHALGEDWPVVEDELQHHARGCYSVLSRVKAENRELEHQLMAAERLAAFTGSSSVQAALEDAWQGVLFNQFHDIMAGTSIRTAYEDVWQLYAHARDISLRLGSAARQALARELRIEERGQALVVWNSLPWARSTAVQFEVRMGGWGRSWRDVPGTPRITDAKGNELPSQLLSIEFDLNAYIAHIEALVDVPALGAVPIYAEVPVVQAAAHSPEAQPGNTLVNDAWQLTLDAETGAICSLVERASGAELLGGPAGVALVVDDPSDTWSHDIASFRNVIGQFKAQSAPVVVHDGPTRRTLRVISSWGSSTITSQCTVRPGQTAIELEMEIDWHEELKMLKLAFPLGVQDASVTASAPYGMITRQPNGEEEPCQAWVDLSGMLEGGQGGLCCITDSKYGYDALDSELRLSILRSPIYAFHDPRKVVEGVDYHFIDQGKQVVRLLLIPHRGDWRDANPDRASYAMLEPLTAEPIRQSQGGTDQVSYLAVQPENLVVSVVKRSEERGELLVRGYETAGTACEALLHSPALGRRWRASIGAHEIFTLRLADTGGETEKLNLLEEPLPA